LPVPAIGIELYGESHFLHLLSKIIQAWLQGRFTSTNTDTIQESLSAFQKREKIFFRNHIIGYQHHFFRQDAFGIMTKMTAEITALRKNYTGYLAWIID